MCTCDVLHRVSTRYVKGCVATSHEERALHHKQKHSAHELVQGRNARRIRRETGVRKRITHQRLPRLLSFQWDERDPVCLSCAPRLCLPVSRFTPPCPCTTQFHLVRVCIHICPRCKLENKFVGLRSPKDLTVFSGRVSCRAVDLETLVITSYYPA